MKEFEYMTIEKTSDRVGHKWETKGNKNLTDYTDMSLLQVLNILGIDGWEMCGSFEGKIILKRIVV